LIALRNGPGAGQHSDRSSYFSELLMAVNLVFSLVPRPLMMLMIAKEMPAAIKPYSMAVAPVSSRKKFKSSRIEPLPFSKHLSG
jgi:hypothetical protein